MPVKYIKNDLNWPKIKHSSTIQCPARVFDTNQFFDEVLKIVEQKSKWKNPLNDNKQKDNIPSLPKSEINFDQQVVPNDNQFRQQFKSFGFLENMKFCPNVLF